MTWGKCARVLFLATALGLSIPGAHAGSADQCGRGWVYFDLGNTLVDTSDWDHLKYIAQAHEYLLELKAAGFHLGMITNIPETWGVTQEAKLATLKSEIAKAWTESEAFPWSDFEHILLPPSDLDRKPAPYLFAQALGLHPDCPIAYEGEDASEVRAALKAGFTSGYTVGKNSPEGFFLPIDRIFPKR